MQIYPGIKARMGDWDYYLVRMTMREVAREVMLASDLWEDRTLGDAIQRELDESRVKQQIVNFLSRRQDRFFASIVVAAIGGKPKWTPLDTRFGDAFGELSFGSDPRYYALDGQHRLRAIQELMSDLTGAPDGFDQEQLSVLVIVREEQAVDDAVWLRRYRRLFSSLNRYAKPTNLDTNIIMDEDDVFAIVTRRLITDHSFFRSGGRERESFRVLTKGKNLKSGSSHFTSLQTLYSMNRVLLMPEELRRKWGSPKELRVHLQFRPDEAEVDSWCAFGARTWDALLSAIHDLNGKPEFMRSHEIPDPNPDGHRDHLLFWPVGQELLSEVARALMDQGRLDENADVESMAIAISPLSKVNWELKAAPWRHLLLVPAKSAGSSWRMRNEDRKAAVDVATALLRWIVGLDRLDEDDTKVLRESWMGLLYPEPPSADHVDALWREIVELRDSVLLSKERSAV